MPPFEAGYGLRRALMGAGLLTLLVGVLAGLQRLGYPTAAGALLGPWHGVVMTGGFAGLLISLERAVALEEPWALGAPILVLVGSLGLALGWEAAPWAYALAGIWAVLVQVRLARRRVDAASVVMALGSAAWALGMWVFASGGDLASAVLFWIAFPVLVIAGERLELAFQVRPRGGAWWVFQGAVALVLAGALLGWRDVLTGAQLEAVGMLGLGLWMLRFDILGRGFAQGGSARYMALALWSGYACLALAGVMLWAWGTGYPLFWDAAVHALFLGFMFAMIFAHAVVIFPALSGVPLQWHAGHYVHLILLQTGLALRCSAAFSGSDHLKRHGSLCAALGLGAFLINQVISAVKARRSSE